MEVDRLTIFDLDYTLTRRGTWGRFTWMNVKRRPHLWLPLLFSAGWTQWQYRRGRRPRKDVKLAMMRWAMKGKTRAELTRTAEQFAEREIATGLRAGARQAIEKHKAQGDILMIASAAVDILVAPIARRLDIPHYVATDMSWDADGRLEMKFASENCYAEEKVRRVEYYVNCNFSKQFGDFFTTFYSDSYADIALLRVCDSQVAVHPDSRLQKAAETSEIKIEFWDK